MSSEEGSRLTPELVRRLTEIPSVKILLLESLDAPIFPTDYEYGPSDIQSLRVREAQKVAGLLANTHDTPNDGATDLWYRAKLTLMNTWPDMKVLSNKQKAVLKDLPTTTLLKRAVIERIFKID